MRKILDAVSEKEIKEYIIYLMQRRTYELKAEKAKIEDEDIDSLLRYCEEMNKLRKSREFFEIELHENTVKMGLWDEIDRKELQNLKPYKMIIGTDITEINSWKGIVTNTISHLLLDCGVGKLRDEMIEKINNISRGETKQIKVVRRSLSGNKISTDELTEGYSYISSSITMNNDEEKHGVDNIDHTEKIYVYTKRGAIPTIIACRKILEKFGYNENEVSIIFKKEEKECL